MSRHSLSRSLTAIALSLSATTLTLAFSGNAMAQNNWGPKEAGPQRNGPPNGPPNGPHNGASNGPPSGPPKGAPGGSSEHRGGQEQQPRSDNRQPEPRREANAGNPDRHDDHRHEEVRRDVVMQPDHGRRPEFIPVDNHHGGNPHYDNGHYGGGHYDGGHYDSHHFEEHHYPSHGVVITSLPPAHQVYAHGGTNFYFSAGVWYRPYGPRFVVVAPPIGLFIPFLPPFYAVRVIGPSTYYVADDVYYAPAGTGNGYVVVDKPQETVAAADPVAKMFIYPREGQSTSRQEQDRYECHDWAMGQSGFDPTAPHGGVALDQFDAKRSDYQRASGACLDARGYTVK